MSAEGESVCSGGPKLIFACSGAADVGAITDVAARKMNKDGVGKMFCTAGLGGKVEPILKTTHAASKILVLDGCGLDCVKRSLQEAGIEEYEHLRVTDMGMEKGKTEVCESNVEKVTTKGMELLG